MKALQIVILLAGLPFFAFTAYFFVMALFGLKKTKAAKKSAPLTRFAVVIAARNEEDVIGNLIDSLNAQDYPRDMFEVIAAPNNCTDNTEGISKLHGARIFNHAGKVTSKGEVLTQVVDEIIFKESFDAFCVFDADNLVAPDFLQRLNNELCCGKKVVQGFRDSKNPRQTAISGCYSIWYWMLNRFHNQARNAMGLSAVINGSGFAVTTEFLRKTGGWHTLTMTEDTEFSAQTALLNERVYFVPDAVLYDEQPLTFNVSWKQRRRWVTGSLQGLELYGARLLKASLLNRNVVTFDMLISLLLPIFGLASFIYGIISSCIFGFVPMLVISVASLICSALGAAAVAIFTIKLKNKKLSGMGKAIMSFWLFLGSYLAITVSCLFKKQKKWDPIIHTNSVNLRDINAA